MPDRTESFHETFARDQVKGGSDKAFGLTVGSILVLIGLARGVAADASTWSVLLLCSVGGVLVAFGFLAPRLLAPLNRAWTKLGMLLAMVVSPVVMAFIFFVTMLPIALVMRATGHDPLRLRRKPEATSYWIERQPPGPNPRSMRNQF